MLWIEIERELAGNILCGIVYRHPSSNLENVLNNLYSIIERINQEKKLCIMSGYFNINLINYDKHPPTAEFINTLNSFFLEPRILKSTRITSHTATLIDNIFFNSIDYQTTSGNLLHNLSDHLPNVLIIDRLPVPIQKEKKYKRDYSNYNEEAFLNEFRSVDWYSNFRGITDVSQMFDKFYLKVSDIVNRHLPQRPLSRKEIKFQSKPWITQEYTTQPLVF